MLRLAMMAFRRSPRGHDWSVVGQAEKVLLWAFYSIDQAKRQKIDLNNILVMIPSNQISTNIKKFTWIEWIFCLSAGIIWGWKNKRQKSLANRLFGLFESTKKAKKCVNFKTLNMVCDMLKMFAKLWQATITSCIPMKCMSSWKSLFTEMRRKTS